MSLNDTPAIINLDTFNHYHELWMNTVKAGSDEPLQQSFCALPSQNRLLALSFTMGQITELVSVVGAHYIAVRFLVSDDKRFTMAMYAADANYVRLSSYYQAGYPTSLVGSPDDTSIPGQQVPNVLAQGWLTAWAGPDTPAPVGSITRSLFDSSEAGKPLEGYTFEIDDFLAMFPAPSQPQSSNLLVYFGLHGYHRPNESNIDVPVQTFGLVLRRTAVDGGVTFYDMTAPCPPVY